MILSISFLEWYTRLDDVMKYKSTLQQNIFLCMDMMNVGYLDVMSMPVKRFYDMIKWKIEIEEEKLKQMEKINNSPKTIR